MIANVKKINNNNNLLDVLYRLAKLENTAC